MASDAKNAAGPQTGPGPNGKPVVDPTANVLALVEAANQRQDDLRAASDKFNAASISHADTVGKLRAMYEKQLGDLREYHAKELRRLETDRTNSIRQVDVTYGQNEAKRVLDAIQIANAAAGAAAETLRKQTADTFMEVTNRLAALEKAYYEGKGKEAVSDPVMAELIQEVKNLAKAGTAGTAKGEGRMQLWQMFLGASVLIGPLLAVLTYIATK